MLGFIDYKLRPLEHVTSLSKSHSVRQLYVQCISTTHRFYVRFVANR